MGLVITAPTYFVGSRDRKKSGGQGGSLELYPGVLGGRILQISLQQQKGILRTRTLARRDTIPPEIRIDKSIQAAERSIQYFNFEPGTVVSGFFPIRSEIDPRPLLELLRKRGARLCLPVVVDKTTIIFRELVRGAQLVDTGFGTCGPGADAAVLDPEILIMPMSVFDRNGGRIGYGAGHYDRAIDQLKTKGMKPILVGMAFDCQETEKVPIEAHDQPLVAVITESGYLEVEDQN